MLIKILLISMITIISSCGSSSSSSPSGSDQNNTIQETIILNKFNESCETDYSHSFKTNYYINSDFIITSSNSTIDSKGAKSTEEESSVDLRWDHKAADQYQSLSIVPCNEKTNSIIETTLPFDKISQHTSYKPDQITYHYYKNPNLKPITQNSSLSFSDHTNHMATVQLSGISITIATQNYHFKTTEHEYYDIDLPTVKNYTTIQETLAKKTRRLGMVL